MTAFDHAQAVYDAMEPDYEKDTAQCGACYDECNGYIGPCDDCPDPRHF